MQEEQSVSEILSSIKLALSKDIEESFNQDVKTNRVFENNKSNQDIIIELTPEMRITRDSFSQSSVPAPLDRPSEAQLSAQLQSWLNTHLPEIVERVIAKEIGKIVQK